MMGCNGCSSIELMLWMFFNFLDMDLSRRGGGVYKNNLVVSPASPVHISHVAGSFSFWGLGSDSRWQELFSLVAGRRTGSGVCGKLSRGHICQCASGGHWCRYEIVIIWKL